MTQLNIKSTEARRLAEEAALLSGTTITQAITDALRARVTLLHYANDSEKVKQRSLEAGFYSMIAGSRAEWNGAQLSIDHGDLLYDESGLPR